MRTRIQNAGVCLLALAALCLFSGCASIGGPITLQETHNDIEWELVRYQNRTIYGYVTPGQQLRVNTARDAYEAAFKEAAAQAGGNLNAPTPQNVKAAADELLSVLTTVN